MHYALLFLLVSQAGVPTQSDVRVTFEHAAAPAQRVLAELGEKVNLDLKVSGSVKKDVVAVRFDDLPWSSVKEQLAKVLDAEWETKDDGVYLTRSLVKEKAQRATAAALRTEVLRASLQKSGYLKPMSAEENQAMASEVIKTVATMSSPNPPTEIYSKYNSLSETVPNARLAYEAMAEIGLEKIGAIEDGQCVVFCNKPNKVQSPWGRSGDTFYTHCVRVALDWDAALVAEGGIKGNMQGEFRSFGGPTSISYGPNGESIETGYPTPPLNGGYVALKVKRNRQNLEIKLWVLDPNHGKLIDRDIYVSTSPTNVNNVKTLPGYDTLLALTETELAVGKAFSNAGSGDSDAKPPVPEALEVLTSSGKRDILDGIPSLVVLQAAKHKKLNLIALLPDDVIREVTSYATYGKPTVGEALRRIELVQMVVEEQNGWLIAKPEDQYGTRNARIPRAELSKYTAAVAKASLVGLDELAEYASATGSSQPFEQGVELAKAATGIADISINLAYGWDALRLYGGLSHSQKLMALNGVTIPISSLLHPQKDAVNHMVYGGDCTLTLRPPKALDRSHYTTTGPAYDPTWALPDGLPPMADVSFLVQKGKVLYSKSISSFWPAPYSLEDRANRLYGIETKKVFGSSDDELTFREGYAETLQMVLALRPARYIGETVALDRVDKSGAWTKFDSSPQFYRDALNKLLEEYRTGRRQWTAGGAIR